VPYALGVGGILPALLIANRIQWWLAMTAFLLIATAALLHTVLRGSQGTLTGEAAVYGLLRGLLIRLAACCAAAAIFAAAVAAIIMSWRSFTWLVSTAPIALIPVGIVMVVQTERGLTFTL
jgi:hypothetical protein